MESSNQNLDQNQFLKQVRERAQVVSKSARQKPGDVVERFGQVECEGDKEMQDYLAVIRGTDPEKQEVQIKIEISDDMELDFASGLASNAKLDFSKEHMKASLAQRRIQKRRRPQSWAWVASSSGSAVQIDHGQGISGNEISLSVKLDEEPGPEKEEIEVPKRPCAQNRFSTPAFSNNLMMDLGNFLKKPKKTGNKDSKKEHDRPASPEKSKEITHSKRMVSPPVSKRVTPINSPRSASASPDQQVGPDLDASSPRSRSPLVDRRKVIVAGNYSPRMQSPLTLEVEVGSGQTEKSKELDHSESFIDSEPPSDAKMLGDDKVVGMPDCTSGEKMNQSLEPKSSKEEVENANAGKPNMTIQPLLKAQPSPPKPKPKPKAHGSSAMLAKAAAISNQNQIAKEEEKQTVVNKPRWLEELKLKKQKEEIPKMRRSPLVVKAIEPEDQLSTKDDSSTKSALPSWIQKEASKNQKRAESDDSSACDRTRLLTSGGELISRFKDSKSEDKQEPNWLKELNKRKQNREVISPKNEDAKVPVADKKAKAGAFDYRSYTKQDEIERLQTEDKAGSSSDDLDGDVVSISHIKKRLSKKARPGMDLAREETLSITDMSKTVKFGGELLESDNILIQQDQTDVKPDKADHAEKAELGRLCDSTSTKMDIDDSDIKKDRKSETESIFEISLPVDSTELYKESKESEKRIDLMSPDQSFEKCDGVKARDVMNLELLNPTDVPFAPQPDEQANADVRTASSDSNIATVREKILVTTGDIGIGLPSKQDTVLQKATSPAKTEVVQGNNQTSDEMLSQRQFESKKISNTVTESQTSKDSNKDTPVATNRKYPAVSKRPPVIKAKPKVFKKPESGIEKSTLKPKSPEHNFGSFSNSGSTTPVQNESPSVSRENSAVLEGDNQTLWKDSQVLQKEKSVSREDNPLLREKSPVSRDNSPLLREDSPVPKISSPEPDKIKSLAENEPVKNDKSINTREDVPKPMRVKLVRVNSFEQGALSKPKFEQKTKEAEDKSPEPPILSHSDVSNNKTDAQKSEINTTLHDRVDNNNIENQEVFHVKEKIEEVTKVENKKTDRNESEEVFSSDTNLKQDDLQHKDAVKTVNSKREEKVEPQKSEFNKAPLSFVVQEKKFVDLSKMKLPPPKIKPKPKIKPVKDLVKPVGITSKQLNEKNEKNIENSIMKEESKTDDLQVSKENKETKENIVDDTKVANDDKVIDAVSMRSGTSNKSKNRRPVSMIEDMRPLSQNKQYGIRERTSSTSSNKRFSTELEKKQNACWFRGVLPTNVENINEYDDIPAWKKQLLARLKPAENTAKKPSSEDSFRSRTTSSPSAPYRPQKKDGTPPPAISETVDSEAEKSNKTADQSKSAEDEETSKQSVPSFMKEFTKKQNIKPKPGMPKKLEDEEWVLV